MSRVTIGQPQTFGGEAVDVGRLDDRVSVATKVALSDVVAEHKDKVWFQKRIDMDNAGEPKRIKAGFLSS